MSYYLQHIAKKPKQNVVSHSFAYIYMIQNKINKLFREFEADGIWYLLNLIPT